jgi:3-hydroxybutyryl-CoA dehydrogenase
MNFPQKVGVLGGGTMGAGIAFSFAKSGSAITLVERDQVSVEAARERILSSISRAAVKGDFPSVSIDQFVFSTDYTDFKPVELVVEAVPENIDIKIAALTSVEKNLSENAWLASNTSSLSLTTISQALIRPERFCGLHFFNPVPASSLVEIVLTPASSEELAALAIAWVTGLGKTPITVNDAPGFASSRLGLAIALEAMRMLEEGVASAADIDTAMVLGYRHAAGPLKTTDLVGLDVRLNIAEYLHETLGDRFEPPAILREMVARGDLGRKTGRGFFDYSK